MGLVTSSISVPRTLTYPLVLSEERASTWYGSRGCYIKRSTKRGRLTQNSKNLRTGVEGLEANLTAFITLRAPPFPYVFPYDNGLLMPSPLKFAEYVILIWSDDKDDLLSLFELLKTDQVRQNHRSPGSANSPMAPRVNDLNFA